MAGLVQPLAGSLIVFSAGDKTVTAVLQAVFVDFGQLFESLSGSVNIDSSRITRSLEDRELDPVIFIGESVAMGQKVLSAVGVAVEYALAAGSVDDYVDTVLV